MRSNNETVNNGGIITVLSAGVLTLSGTEIIGGTINDGNSIVIAGASKIDGTAGNNVALNGGAVTVNAKLTLDDVTVSGTTITDTSGSTIELDNNVTLTGSATIQGSSAAKAAITIWGRWKWRRGQPAQRHADQHRAHGSGRQRRRADAVRHRDHRRHHQRWQQHRDCGASKIDGTAGNNVALNGGAVTVKCQATLDDVTVSGTTITDTSGSTSSSTTTSR